MSFHFIDELLSVEGRYSIGYEKITGEYYISFPLTNHLVDYEEYYRLTKDEHDLFLLNQIEAKIFLEKCYRHLEDHRMIFYPPAPIRGAPN
jgi:hypothetical protein